jgi:hypothetical protein
MLVQSVVYRWREMILTIRCWFSQLCTDDERWYWQLDVGSVSCVDDKRWYWQLDVGSVSCVDDKRWYWQLDVGSVSCVQMTRDDIDN